MCIDNLSILDDDQSEVKSTKMTSHLNDKAKLISDNTVNQNNTKKQQVNIFKKYLRHKNMSRKLLIVIWLT